MKPARAAASLIAALLSGFAILYGALNPATADPAAAIAPVAGTQIPPEPKPRVYLFRGFAGIVFSRGMDTLAGLIEQAGFSATINEAMMCPLTAKDAIRDYRANPAPIVVVGHSVGAACAIAFAGMLGDEDVPVSLVVTTDPNRIAGDVPKNVQRYINIFQSTSVLGGCDVKPGKGFTGHYASYDLKEHQEISHLNIEKMKTIHEQVLSKIQGLTTTPATSGGDPVPIRFVVPADADLELWDSGIAIKARGGDTLDGLAAQYHLPLWSLTQINPGADKGPLAAGRRLIVPQHLLPQTADGGATVSQVPAKQ
ncbi:MAG: LysM peptidoglycan-binding domain-containing protein [Hyphomicrobiales bacterium]|nr:LysM peptidoglycan-binding domain-containing protein [Hyphomicrobiales bacterium]MDE1973927.1 LysM peptidoglycan-binding domain-containing protein [Hyphomicrobiales bacterium]MDE2283381.1 LysM peptidoglycan-binding domain-containing protein [Hyphomicrobiales bacterium]MDE2374485.1 LysM peptidoglycan-binding domain-containing protein [Hyphomicrobiales bacterium]